MAAGDRRRGLRQPSGADEVFRPGLAGRLRVGRGHLPAGGRRRRRRGGGGGPGGPAAGRPPAGGGPAAGPVGGGGGPRRGGNPPPPGGRGRPRRSGSPLRRDGARLVGRLRTSPTARFLAGWLLIEVAGYFAFTPF